MFECKDVTEEASNYINGNVPLRKRMGLFFHLMICSCCRNYLQQLRSTISAVNILKPKEKATKSTDDLAQKLHDLHMNDH